ncbi:5-methylcytosine-specific restriction endonuclease McrA [Virgibacillus halotolerans]|uniref:HNH endonuclease n=1 Tax=Virgibacillus halotolerans TaxID=1071053 RepID=UPI0019617199|nr:HNH endonuclease [Virgibacillus halotolerans]MBM7598096.1 5-methylcytosine-specific restriction endonuclease McrA [Virgibacillus halotolerans]
MSQRNTRYDIEYVKEVFLSNGFTLLEDEYINVDTPMDAICICGRKTRKTLRDVRTAKGCRGCMGSRMSARYRRKYEDVKQYFEDNGCTLLSPTYKNNREKLDYICECGNVSKISFGKFKEGKRCKECGKRKISNKLKGVKRPERNGENHPNWKHDKTDEERLADRKYREYHEWRNSVFVRDGYTCQHCGQLGESLEAHHLNGYSWDIENRVNIDNGITLCESCHSLYHFQFGKQNVVKEDFLYFIQGVSWDMRYQVEV